MKFPSDKSPAVVGAAFGLLLVSMTLTSAEEETTPAPEDGGKKEEAKPSQTPTGATDAFELGQLTVYGKRDGGMSGQVLSQAVVTSEDIRIQNRNTLDDALRTTPGVESSNSGGARNERMIYVRGFDRWQVPLSIDGVRVYLPEDNRLD